MIALKKLGRWLILLLAGALLLILIRQERNRIPDFSIRKPEKVTKIVLAGTTQAVVLVKKNKVWTFADGNPVREYLPETFLKVMHRIRIKSPATKKDLEMARADTAVEKVTVRFRGWFLPVRKFIVYTSVHNLYGNLMTEREKKEAYVCYLPGNKGNLGDWFNTTLSFWKPHLLLAFTPTDITMVELIPADHTDQSFRLTQKNPGSFVLTNPISGDTLEKVIVEKASRYFSYFYRIPFLRYETGLDRSALDSLQKVPPLYIIKVSSHNQPDRKLRILPLLNPDGKTDTNLALALINGEDYPVIIRYFDLDPVLKERNYFTEN